MIVASVLVTVAFLFALRALLMESHTLPYPIVTF